MQYGDNVTRIASGGINSPFQTTEIRTPRGETVEERQRRQDDYAQGRYAVDQNLAFQRQQQADKNNRFNTIWGSIQGQLGGLNQSVGGQSPPSPPMGGGQIWGAQDIQQNLNANRASTDRQVATQNANMQGSLAGRGFGSRSPLAAALETQTAMSGMGQKADYARQFVPQARQQNANYGLQVGQAREQQFANRQNEDIERRRTTVGQQTSLLNALAGLV